MIEVITAVAIFAFAVLGLLIAIESTIDAARSIQREHWIRAQLESHLSALLSQKLKPFENESEPDERGVRYVDEVSREELVNSEKTILNGFWRVRCKARWIQEGQEQEWEASVLAYD